MNPLKNQIFSHVNNSNECIWKAMTNKSTIQLNEIIILLLTSYKCLNLIRIYTYLPPPPTRSVAWAKEPYFPLPVYVGLGFSHKPFHKSR
jgi:hypothetical protein